MEFKPVTYQTRRESLVTLLRNPQLWPEGFRWNYGASETCAIGLMSRTGLINDVCHDAAADYLGLSEDEGDTVFLGVTDHFAGFDMCFATPAMVAFVLILQKENANVVS